jgi:hypothetical protein
MAMPAPPTGRLASWLAGRSGNCTIIVRSSCVDAPFQNTSDEDRGKVAQDLRGLAIRWI